VESFLPDALSEQQHLRKQSRQRLGTRAQFEQRGHIKRIAAKKAIEKTHTWLGASLSCEALLEGAAETFDVRLLQRLLCWPVQVILRSLILIYPAHFESIAEIVLVPTSPGRILFGQEFPVERVLIYS
jgi:hypothetical protein